MHELSLAANIFEVHSHTAAMKVYLGNLVLATQRLLTTIGELTGIKSLIYNPLVTYGFKRAAVRNAPLVVDSILANFPQPEKVVDFGCGLGIYIKEWLSRGIDSFGFEYSLAYRCNAAKQGLVVHAWDLSNDDTLGLLETPVDLAICLEVAEHIPASLAPTLARVLVRSAKIIVFTAAQPGQGGTGHINEQARSYWIDIFCDAGALYDQEATQRLSLSFKQSGTFAYLHNNLSVFNSHLQL